MAKTIGVSELEHLACDEKPNEDSEPGGNTSVNDSIAQWK